MTRVPTIDRITEVFARLESYLKLKGRQNLNDAAVLAEDFCKHLLNRLYGHSLINLNTLAPNAAATDLIDSAKRIGFQITANATTEKIRDVHRKATDPDIAARLEHLTILFLVAKAPPEPEPSGNFTPCERPAIISRDLSSLISDIREMDVPKQQELADFLEQEWGHTKHPWNQDTRISNLPFASLGPLFIGRKKFMGTLNKSLGDANPTVIKSVQAIHGMGGVGKTRAAIEYAWRHKADFRALLFVTADSPDSLRRNLAALCAPAILDLPEHAATDTDTQVDAVLAWLRKSPDWLLILDNVDSPAAQAAVQALATPFTHGKILITSRLAAWPTGFAALDLDVLTLADSVKLLTDHTDGFRIPEPAEAAAAADIARLVGCLALALEQAAAHIRKIRCSFATYLKKWRAAETRLLADYHLRGIGDYHAPVAGQQPLEELPRSLCVTFDASFSQLAPPARHLLQLLAWLAPDPMPVAHLEKLDALPAAAETLADLDELHLVRYSADNRAFAVHRLIQEIVRREQPEAQPPPLREALEWVNWLYVGDPNDVRIWDSLAPLASHAVAVATFAADHNIPEPTGRLLSQAALHLNTRADYRAAEPLMRRALAIAENSYGPDHSNVAVCLNNLALLLQTTNRLSEAEPLYLRALKIAEDIFDPEHPFLAFCLACVAHCYHATNRLAEAEPLMRRVIAVFETSYGKSHPDVATSLNNLAQLLQATNRHAEAEQLMIRALAIDEASYGQDHPKVARSLNNVATLLNVTNRPSEAEPLMRRALAIDEASYGSDHPEIARDLNNLAQLLNATNRLAEAEPLMRRALAIDEACYGPDHPDVALKLNNLAVLLQATNRFADAEPLMTRALAIAEASFGSDHPDVALKLNNLAQLLQTTNRLAEAERLMIRALAIDEASYGPDHPIVAIRLNNLAQLLQATNRFSDAAPLLGRALAIDEASFGPDHPDVARDLNNLATLLQATNRLAEAEPIMRRALTIWEGSLGPDHPHIAASLNNLAQLLKATNRLSEAEPLMRRALAIDETSFGPDHPDVATDINNLARLLQDTNRLVEAEPLMRRVVEIFLNFTRATGHPHPHLQTAVGNYAALLKEMGRSGEEIGSALSALGERYGVDVSGMGWR